MYTFQDNEGNWITRATLITDLGKKMFIDNPATDEEVKDELKRRKEFDEFMESL